MPTSCALLRLPQVDLPNSEQCAVGVAADAAQLARALEALPLSVFLSRPASVLTIVFWVLALRDCTKLADIPEAEALQIVRAPSVEIARAPAELPRHTPGPRGGSHTLSPR